jgi:hypothetical protein
VTWNASFGAGGKQTLNFGGADRATHIAIAPDGRIVVVGSTEFRRTSASGESASPAPAASGS